MRFQIPTAIIFLVFGLAFGFKLELLNLVVIQIDNIVDAFEERDCMRFAGLYEKYRVEWRKHELVGFKKSKVKAFYGNNFESFNLKWSELMPEADQIWIYREQKDELVFFKEEVCIGVKPLSGLGIYGSTTLSIPEQLACNSLVALKKTIQESLVSNNHRNTIHRMSN